MTQLVAMQHQNKTNAGKDGDQQPNATSSCMRDLGPAVDTPEGDANGDVNGDCDGDGDGRGERTSTDDVTGTRRVSASTSSLGAGAGAGAGASVGAGLGILNRRVSSGGTVYETRCQKLAIADSLTKLQVGTVGRYAGTPYSLNVQVTTAPALSHEWSFKRMYFHKNALSHEWSFTRMHFHTNALSHECTFTRMHFHTIALSYEWLLGAH